MKLWDILKEQIGILIRVELLKNLNELDFKVKNKNHTKNQTYKLRQMVVQMLSVKRYK